MKTNKMKTPTPTTSHIAPGSLAQLSELARQLTAQGKPREAAAAIEQIFAGDVPKDEGSARLLAEARQSYIACQEELVRQDRLAGAQVAAELQAETEKIADYPIRVAFEGDAGVPDGRGVRLAWEQGCGQHLVVCRHEPEHLQTYHLAVALMRIQTETEACRARKSRVPTVSMRQKRKLLSLFHPRAAKILSGEEPHITINPSPEDVALDPFRLLLASAPYMLVDARLRQRYPLLRPAQFLSLTRTSLDDWEARGEMIRMTPLRDSTITALDGLQGLFLDWLSAGVTDFAERYRLLDGFDLSQKLWQHWQTRFPEMRPGDEFDILDHFAAILGLPGTFTWVPGPSKPSGALSASPDNAPSF